MIGKEDLVEITNFYRMVGGEYCFWNYLVGVLVAYLLYYVGFCLMKG
jgi:hypothetical protein